MTKEVASDNLMVGSREVTYLRRLVSYGIFYFDGPPLRVIPYLLSTQVLSLQSQSE
jgi:hypothetical protein